MLQSTHKMANLNQNEICAVLCSKRQQQHDGENGYVKAGLLNSEIPIQIQTQTFTEHVLLANVRAISCLKNTNHRTRKRQEWGGGELMKNFCVSTRLRMRHPFFNNQLIHYLKTPSSIQNSNQYPRFHVPSLFPDYCTYKLL